MYLIDTNVISEIRKGKKANPGVKAFFQRIAAEETPVFLSVVTLGELRRGIELIRHRGDTIQAQQLEQWLESLVTEFRDHLLPLCDDAAQLWGRMRVPNPENALDKQIAATALLHALTVVTRNVSDFDNTGVVTLDPFAD